MITCKILKLVALTVVEAELGALFFIKKEARTLCLSLQELGYPHLQTPTHVNNTTATCIMNRTIQRQRSSTMEMQHFWLLDKMSQQYFKLYYQPGQENLADYPTKYHTSKIHQHV